MRPVLIVGVDDAEVRAVSTELERLGCPSRFLSTRAPLELDLAEDRARWRIGDPPLALELARDAEPPFSAVFIRLLALTPTHPADSSHWTRDNFLRARFYDGEILALKLALLQHLQACGVPMYNGVSVAELELKASRLITMMQAGLPVPPSLFTQDAAALRAFAERHGELIYKPVTGGAQVRRLAATDLEPPRIDRLARAPVAFQPVVAGPDVRVYVCDGEVLGAVRIHSDHDIDARGRETGYEVLEPSASVAGACVRACAALGLRFSAVDLREGAAGEFRLLECNNHPMFANIDRALGGAVARGLALRLAGERGPTQLSAAP